jgi:hypothetical protein
MLQWIAAFEKIAALSHYLGGNRFGSFAPIRLNVAAQWLVDGVRLDTWILTEGCLSADVTLARLLLELVASNPARQGDNLYPRLVAVSW